MKNVATFILCLAAILLSACKPDAIFSRGNDPQSPSNLIIGHWVSVEPITVKQNGSTVRFLSNSATYKHNGRANSQSYVQLFDKNIPEGLSKYRISAITDWKITDRILEENLINLHVIPDSPSPQAGEISRLLEDYLISAPHHAMKFKPLMRPRLF